MKEKILKAVYDAIDQVNEQNAGERHVPKSPETALFGKGSALDSLGLVSLVVATEEKVEQAFGEMITLADDRALSAEVSPFTTVSTLVDYVEQLLRERQARG
jgi:D-alanine--poly(phosphoribitol) ligase subunit 2